MANGGGSNMKPESDVYTAFLVISTAFVVAATLFVAYKSQQYFGTWLPF